MTIMGRAKILCCFLNLILFNSYAQRCETYNYSKKNTVINSYTNARVTDQNKSLRDTLANEVIIIPVVIHVLYNTSTENISDAQVLSQLAALNNDYRKLNIDAANVPAAFAPVAADARITFCLAKTNPSGKLTSGIIHKYTSEQSWLADDGMKFSAQGGDDAWDAKTYLNIWVCNLFGRSLGYSSLPGSQADKDGVVIQYDVFGTTGTLSAPFNKGRTATHEIGHWLGLKHLWGDANCGDDGIADTPPQQSYNNGCPTFPHVTTCSINGNGDMFMNFMDFTDDACMYMFTQGQKTKMRSIFAAGGARNSFLNSSVCDSPSVQGGPVPTDSLKNKITLSVYPNPSHNYINIESNNSLDLTGKQINIYNVYGAEIISQILPSQKNTIAVDKLPSGIYLLKIGDGKEVRPVKFIKN